METALYPPVKAFLEARGFAVKGEVRGCDVVAVKANAKLLVIAELKLGLSMELLLQAADPFEAIRLKTARLAVVRRGRVIARAPERQSTLELPGRPPQVSLEFVPGSL